MNQSDLNRSPILGMYIFRSSWIHFMKYSRICYALRMKNFMDMALSFLMCFIHYSSPLFTRSTSVKYNEKSLYSIDALKKHHAIRSECQKLIFT